MYRWGFCLYITKLLKGGGLQSVCSSSSILTLAMSCPPPCQEKKQSVANLRTHLCTMAEQNRNEGLWHQRRCRDWSDEISDWVENTTAEMHPFEPAAHLQEDRRAPESLDVPHDVLVRKRGPWGRATKPNLVGCLYNQSSCRLFCKKNPWNSLKVGKQFRRNCTGLLINIGLYPRNVWDLSNNRGGKVRIL